MLVLASDWRRRMLLNILQHTEQPHSFSSQNQMQRIIQHQMSIVLQLRNCTVDWSEPLVYLGRGFAFSEASGYVWDGCMAQKTQVLLRRNMSGEVYSICNQECSLYPI